MGLRALEIRIQGIKTTGEMGKGGPGRQVAGQGGQPSGRRLTVAGRQGGVKQKVQVAGRGVLTRGVHGSTWQGLPGTFVSPHRNPLRTRALALVAFDWAANDDAPLSRYTSGRLEE